MGFVSTLEQWNNLIFSWGTYLLSAVVCFTLLQEQTLSM